MRKLDYEAKPSTAADSGEDADFGAVGDAVQARPAEFVRALAEHLYPIGTDIQLFSDPHARANLLAVDPRGAAVVVVVEREGEHSLLERGLMCAGLVAGWEPDFFFRYPTAGPAAKLRAFLQVPGEEINRAQRVVLVAHSHDYAVFSAAQWLAQQHGIEITCVQGRLEPDSGRLNLVRLEAESFHPGEPVETVRIVLPRPAGDAADIGAHREPAPLEPALVPRIASVTGTCRLQTIWRPRPETPVSPAGADPSLRGVSPVEPAARAGTSSPKTALQAGASIEQRASQILEAETTGAEQARRPLEPLPEPGALLVIGPLSREPKPVQSEDDAEPPRAERRLPFRIVGLTCIIAALAAAGVIVLSLPKTPPPPKAAPAKIPEPPPPTATPAFFHGRILDRATGRPIQGARLYYAGRPSRTDAAGEFQLEVSESQRRLLVKAAGYRQAETTIDREGPIRLEPFEVRGYYVSPSHSADPERRGAILNLIRGTSANTVVLGVKDVTGRVNVAVNHPLAGEIGSAARAADVNLTRQVSRWKAQGMYTVGLVTLFKDDLLARAKTDLALRSIESRQRIIDADGIAWADPGQTRVREYNLAVAKAAAEAGFDEIHFDFIRYPSEGLSREGGDAAEYQRRLGNLVKFLRAANELLAPYNVYMSASVFGSVCVMTRPSVIGQQLEAFAEYADYVSPMLYPSYFEPDKKFAVPLRHAYQLVHESLLRAMHRLGGRRLKLRPWLQNFPDRASPNVPLHAHSIFGQLKAAEDARTSGWMLWDARSQYRNTAEAMTMLKGERSGSARPIADTGGGGAIPFPDAGDGPPAASAVEQFRLVAVLFLAACCLAVLYGATRAAWVLRKWSRAGPPRRPPAPRLAPQRAGAWLPRPQFLRSLPHARPR